LEDVSKVVLGIPFSWGKEISIPCIVISKADGHIIKKYMEDNQDKAFDIQVEMDFSVKESNKVNYEVYFSNGYENIYPLLTELKEMHGILGDQVSFEPKYIAHRNPSGLRMECVGEGKYCNYNNNWYYKATGRDILLHNLNEKCIWKLLKNDTAFFEYIDLYATCAKSPHFNETQDSCLYQTIERVNLTIKDVRNCYASNLSVPSKL
jgi:hypothetical protein